LKEGSSLSDSNIKVEFDPTRRRKLRMGVKNVLLISSASEMGWMFSLSKMSLFLSHQSRSHAIEERSVKDFAMGFSIPREFTGKCMHLTQFGDDFLGIEVILMGYLVSTQLLQKCTQKGYVPRILSADCIGSRLNLPHVAY
jgi:hypothetical protein